VGIDQQVNCLPPRLRPSPGGLATTFQGTGRTDEEHARLCYRGRFSSGIWFRRHFAQNNCQPQVALFPPCKSAFIDGIPVAIGRRQQTPLGTAARAIRQRPTPGLLPT